MTEELVFSLTRSDVAGLSNHLRGVAFTDDSVIFGQGGLDSYLQCHGDVRPADLVDGRFAAIIDCGDYFSVFTDAMGQETIYYFTRENVSVDGESSQAWAFSNSLLALLGDVKKFERPSLYLPSMLTGFISGGNAFGAQLISNRTPVGKAKVLPMGCELRIRKSDGSLSVKRVRSGTWLLAADSSGYPEQIEEYVLKTVSRMAAIVESGLFEVFCDVSGGHDSRALLGMLVNLGGKRGSVSFVTDEKKPNDEIVAGLLSRYLKVSIGRRIKHSIRIPAGAAFDLWKKASVGVYLPIVVPRSMSNLSQIRFHGGNFLSKEFGEMSVADKVASIRKWFDSDEKYAQAAQEFMDSFEQIDVDPAHPFAMHLHYINFRARFHYGRHWYTAAKVPTLTPLISASLAKAAFQMPTDEYNRSRVSLDLLLAIDNTLGLIPFDELEKSFSVDFLNRSPFWGKPLRISASSLPKVKVFYSEADHRNQHPAEDGFDGPDFRSLFRAEFDKHLDAAEESGVFTKAYLDRAKAEAADIRGFARGVRAAAHVMHIGILCHEVAGP